MGCFLLADGEPFRDRSWVTANPLAPQGKERFSLLSLPMPNAIMCCKCYGKILSAGKKLRNVSRDVLSAEYSADSLDDGEFAVLLERAARGDHDAQALICQRYEPKVRIIARVMLGPALRSHFDSLDLVQSVHRSLLVGLRDQKFDISTPQKLIALASTMVRRKVARKWRRAKKQISPNGLATSSALAQTLSSLVTPEAGPREIAQRNDQITTLCEQLNEVERQMLMLRLEGYTWPEIAERVGLHPVATRVRWTRLRQRLLDSRIAADWE